MDRLFEVIHICTREEGRKRQLRTAHSTRVTAVRYLLKAGLSETMVSVLAHWSSQQVQRDQKPLILNPGLVEAFVFYNPVRPGAAYSSLVVCPYPRPV